MKVLRKGYEKEVTCPRCKAVLLYLNEDVHLGYDIEGDYEHYVICPECGNHVNVEMKHFSDENHDSMKDYGYSIMHHEDDYHLDDYEGSLLFRHWLEDLKLEDES